MSIADLGAVFCYWFGNPADNTGLCTFQGLAMQFFQFSSILWSTAIALTLYRAVVKRTETDGLMKHFHILCFGVPGVFCLLPLTTTSYGNTGAWCWIQAAGHRDAGTWWRLFIFYLPLWIAITFNAYTYFITIRAMNQLFKSQDEMEIPAKYKKLIQRLSLYPLILVGCWFFGTVNRIQNSIAPESPVYALFFLQVCGRSLQGFLNAIAYGLNPNVRTAWVQLLRKKNRCLFFARFLEQQDNMSRTDDNGEIDEDGERMSTMSVDTTTQV